MESVNNWCRGESIIIEYRAHSWGKTRSGVETRAVGRTAARIRGLRPGASGHLTEFLGGSLVLSQHNIRSQHCHFDFPQWQDSIVCKRVVEIFRLALIMSMRDGSLNLPDNGSLQYIPLPQEAPQFGVID